VLSSATIGPVLEWLASRKSQTTDLLDGRSILGGFITRAPPVIGS